MLARLADRLAPALDRLVDAIAASPARAVAALILAALLCHLPGIASAPLTDRDEGRYVLATKQMFETGDFIDIRNQDVPRYQQPIGIYWLQAIAVATTGRGAEAPVWAYRLPSVAAGAVAAVATWWALVPLIGARAALLAGLMLAATLILGFEARTAKTDAVLLAAITVAMGAMIRIQAAEAPGRGLAVAFWLALALGLLVKGPVIVLVVLPAVLLVGLLTGRWRWTRGLRPILGLVILCLTVVPWFGAIGIISEGYFFVRSAGRNMLGKVAEIAEGHWGPPGYHTAFFWIMAWPMATFLALAIPGIWRGRADESTRILLAWALPAFLAFEMFATKLPHYTMPTYPAIAGLAAAAIVAGRAETTALWRRIAVHGLWALPAGLTIATAVILAVLERGVSLAMTAGFVVATLVGIVATAVALRSVAAAVPLALVTAALCYASAYGIGAARVDTFRLSERIVEAVRAHAPCPTPEVASAQYHEPSFIVAMGTGTRLLEGARAADWLAEGGCRIAIVDAMPPRRGGPSDEDLFLGRLAERGARATRLGQVEGRNTNGGHARRLVLWRLDAPDRRE